MKSALIALTSIGAVIAGPAAVTFAQDAVAVAPTERPQTCYDRVAKLEERLSKAHTKMGDSDASMKMRLAAKIAALPEEKQAEARARFAFVVGTHVENAEARRENMSDMLARLRAACENDEFFPERVKEIREHRKELRHDRRDARKDRLKMWKEQRGSRK